MMEFIPYDEYQLSFNTDKIIKIFTHKNIRIFLINNGDIFYEIEKKFFKIKLPNFIFKYKINIKFIDFNENFIIYLNENILYKYNLDTFEVKTNDFFQKNYNNNYINLIKIDDNNNIFIGTTLGKIFQFNFNTNQEIYYPKFFEYVESINVVNNNLIYGCYKGNIKIVDINKNEIIFTKFLSKFPITNIVKINNQEILIIDKNGQVFYLNLIELNYFLLAGLSTDFLNLTIYHKNLILNYSNNKPIIIKNYFNKQLKTIESNHFNNKTIILITENNLLDFYEDYINKIYEDIFKTFNNFLDDKEKILLDNNIFKIYHLIKSNVFLLNKEKYENSLNNIIDFFIIKSIVLMNNNQNKILQKILKNFEKYKEWNITLIDIKKYTNIYLNFKKMILMKNYYLAYESVKQNTFLLQTPEYKTLENKFLHTFYLCYHRKEKNYEKIKELLNPFLKVKQKKKYCQFLLEKNQILEEYLVNIKNNNLNEAFEILEENPDLEIVEETKILKEKINKFYELTEKIYSIKRTYKAISFLKKIYKYSNEMKIKEIKLKEYENFLNIINDKDKEYHKYLNNNDYILDSKEYSVINKEFNVLYKKYTEKKGVLSVKKINDIFFKYKNIKNKEIITLIKYQYIKILKYINNKKDSNKLNEYIYFYLDIFGADSHIENILRSDELFSKFYREKPPLMLSEIKIEDLPNYLKLNLKSI